MYFLHLQTFWDRTHRLHQTASYLCHKNGEELLHFLEIRGTSGDSTAMVGGIIIQPNL